jgi:hypothetical protein
LPDFDLSERDCRQNAVYSRQTLSGSTTSQKKFFAREGAVVGSHPIDGAAWSD